VVVEGCVKWSEDVEIRPCWMRIPRRLSDKVTEGSRTVRESADVKEAEYGRVGRVVYVAGGAARGGEAGGEFGAAIAVGHNVTTASLTYKITP